MSGVHVQSRPLPQPLPHGHGLAARTSWKRAGKVTVSCARAIETDPRSSGVRSDWRTPLSNSGVSSSERQYSARVWPSPVVKTVCV